MPFTSEKSGESILKLSSPIKHLTVPISPVLYPASLKICRRKYAVEVFPFVPVTAANIILSDGFPQRLFHMTASARRVFSTST